ncbi:MAG TPA: MFS transporter [Conexibacter sp.]|nr:MFS transporter [Conexibacter sp.]
MPSPPSARRSPGWSLALLAFGSLITALDFTIVYVALPDIAREVGFSAHSLQWVVSAYAISYGGFLLLGGRLCDQLGRRRMFVAGMLAFGGASLLGGLAADAPQLIAARVLQGLGGALLFPATLSLVVTTFAEGRERNRAMSVWAGAGAVGLSLGALLGGVLTEAVGWQGVFFVNVPLVLIGAVAAFRLLPADGPRERGRGFDLAGALTGTSGATLLVFAISQAPERGWLSAQVLLAGALALALLAAFVRIEARSASPLMPLRLLRRRSLVSAFGVIFAFGATLQAVPYFLTLYFQEVLGFSALEGGLAFLGPTLAITAGNAIADRLVARFGTRAALLTGMLVGAAGAALLAVQVSAESSYAGALSGIVVAGLGMGLVFPPMFIAAAAGVDGHEQGTASGMASTALQVGSGAGLAVLVGIASSDGLGTTYAVIAAGTLLGAAVAATLPGLSRRRGSLAALAHQGERSG